MPHTLGFCYGHQFLCPSVITEQYVISKLTSFKQQRFVVSHGFPGWLGSFADLSQTWEFSTGFPRASIINWQVGQGLCFKGVGSAMLPSSRASWPVLTGESGLQETKGHQISGGLGWNEAHHHSNHFPLARESHKASPYSRVGGKRHHPWWDCKLTQQSA